MKSTINDIEIVSYDKKKYLELIENFDCADCQMNKLLKEINSHHCTTKLLIWNNEIIAYIAYRCYSINLWKNNRRENFPAIEVHGYAVSKKYHGMLFKDKLTLSHFFFNIMIRYFSKIAKQTIKACFIVLHSVEKAVNFYKKIGFQEARNCELLSDKFNDNCIPMIMSLER